MDSEEYYSSEEGSEVEEVKEVKPARKAKKPMKKDGNIKNFEGTFYDKDGFEIGKFVSAEMEIEEERVEINPKVLDVLVICGSEDEFKEFESKNVRKGVKWIHLKDDEAVYGYQMERDYRYKDRDVDGFAVFTGNYYMKRVELMKGRLGDMMALGKIKQYSAGVNHVTD